MKAPSTVLVITSIAAPNEVLRSFAAGCRQHGYGFLVIGDRSSPAEFQLEDCDHWSLERQTTMPFQLAVSLPERHYARKNLGYLEAIRNGASIILESDDDNFPSPAFWEPRAQHSHADVISDVGWVNVYRHFSSERIWPRGFPLELLQDPVPSTFTAETSHAPIQQGLADGDPDVDAIYRCTGVLPVVFERRERPIALSKGSWCPFNSQNTTWHSEAFPLLYLPSYCSFRMTDIWRSFVAQRICWENGWDVLFHNATVRQERNAHDLMKDFAQEVVGYTNNRAICERLGALDLEPGAEHIAANMERCYKEFIAMGLVDQAELDLLSAWHHDLAKFRRP